MPLQAGQPEIDSPAIRSEEIPLLLKGIRVVKLPFLFTVLHPDGGCINEKFRTKTRESESHGKLQNINDGKTEFSVGDGKIIGYDAVISVSANSVESADSI